MGVTGQPAVNLARRVIAKYSLKPPIDVEALVKQYADLTVARIPFEGIDGVSINLKTPGKKPKVIVNKDNPPLRRRFTLAHELGHILIPWHTGTIADHVDPGQAHATDDYWEFEAEANSFAGELLMPYEWVSKLLAKTPDLAIAHRLASEICEVSLHAAAFRLSQFLPRNLVYAVVQGGLVEFSGRTEGTIANAPGWGEPLQAAAFDYSEEHFTSSIGNRHIHWWRLPSAIALETIDDRSWRDILASIVSDIGLQGTVAAEFKSSVNGVAAYANSVAKRRGPHSVETVVSACMQRFKDRPEYDALVNHPDFDAFVVRKARALLGLED